MEYDKQVIKFKFDVMNHSMGPCLPERYVQINIQPHARVMAFTEVNGKANFLSIASDSKNLGNNP